MTNTSRNVDYNRREILVNHLKVDKEFISILDGTSKASKLITDQKVKLLDYIHVNVLPKLNLHYRDQRVLQSDISAAIRSINVLGK